MTTAAFKSNSGTRNGDNSNKAPPKRRTQRSLSVSAVPRTGIGSDFLNKRDNPLFWSATSPPDKETQNLEIDDKETRKPESESGSEVNGVSGFKFVGQRGRSVTRNVDSNRNKKTIGRSLSRGPSVYGASESEVEQESVRSTKYGGNYPRSGIGNVQRSSLVRRGAYESEVEKEPVRLSKYQMTRKLNMASGDRQKNELDRNRRGTLQRTKSLQSVSSHHSVTMASDDSITSLLPNWDDEISTGSMSEVEEKTIRAVCEQMKGNHIGSVTPTNEIYETVRSEVRRAISDIQNDLETSIRRNNATGIVTADVTSIAPDLVKPGAVELVMDIRREYATKLEESQERARKLRSDLAVEEHRGQELSRILKETLPDPKVSTIQRSHPGRRTSSERKRMSKRLTEEAMSYFDECVSISTFDSSDFSAPEDSLVNSVGAVRAVGHNTSLPQQSPFISAASGPSDGVNCEKKLIGQGNLMHDFEDSVLTANSTSKESATIRGEETADRGRKLQFSFGRQPTETTGIQQEIKSYVRNFAVDLNKDNNNNKKSEITSLHSFNIDEYDLQDHKEGLLFDIVSFKSRIESGSLHLCHGGIPISFSPFASII